MWIPPPPLNEQKRIAAKLDQIMPKIDGVKERLERIPQIIKRFRQSVLNAAVTGKLTKKWRKGHPEVESVDVLLERIRKERLKTSTTAGQKAKIESFFSAVETEDNDSLLNNINCKKIPFFLTGLTVPN